MGRGWEFDYLVNCVIVVPFIFALAIGFAVNLAISNKTMKAVGALVCGVIGVYANLVWSAHCEFSIWLFGLSDLLTAMRMIADMREIHIVFIPFTGTGLVFAYWIEAIVIVLFSLAVSIGSDEKKESKEQDAKSSEMKHISAVVVVCVMSACLLGCSKEESKPLEKPDAQALQTWVAQQKWDAYELGKTAVEKELGGKMTIIGIGVTEIPSNPKLIEPNQKRTAVLALRALSKKVKTVSVDDVVLVLNADIDAPDGKKRRVSAFAGVK